MEQDDLALLRISSDHDGLIPYHQYIEIQIEAELMASGIGAAKMKCPAHWHRRPGHRGGALAGSYPVDVEGTTDMLGPMLAAVDESIVVLQLGHVANHPGDGNPTRVSQYLNTLGQVYAVAKDVVTGFVDNDLAEMDADAELEFLLFVQAVVEACHLLLDGNGCPDGGSGRLELDEHGIPRRVNQRATGAFDSRLPDLSAGSSKVLESLVFPVFNEPHEACNVSMQDCRQPPF